MARAIIGMAVTAVAITGLIALIMRAVLPAFQQALVGACAQASPPKADPRDEVIYDMTMIVRLALAYKLTTGSFPEDPKALKRAWELSHPRDAYPLDPYDGKPYGYAVREDHVLVWSAGPDRRSGTGDDIQINSADVNF